MFPAGTQRIWVPACRDCNGGASDDDEYFVAALALRIEVSDNPVVKMLLPKLMRGVTRTGRRGNTGSIVNTMQPIELRSPSGLYLGRSGIYQPDPIRLSRVIARIVQGLYYREFRARVPDTHGVAVNLVGLMEASDGNQEQWRRGLKGLLDFGNSGTARVVHKKVFSYTFNSIMHDDGDLITVWVMHFFGYTPTICTTVRRDRYAGGVNLF
jgi:hypothetical protein